jgi:hypothetical protein
MHRAAPSDCTPLSSILFCPRLYKRSTREPVNVSKQHNTQLKSKTCWSTGKPLVLAPLQHQDYYFPDYIITKIMRKKAIKYFTAHLNLFKLILEVNHAAKLSVPKLVILLLFKLQTTETELN